MHQTDGLYAGQGQQQIRRGCWRLSNLAFREFRVFCRLSILVLHHLLRRTTCRAFSMDMFAVFDSLGCSIS